MNTFKRIGLAAGLALCAGTVAFADSFNTTNTLNCASTASAAQGVITGWPTNTAATNGIGTGTGTALSLANCDFATFWWKGDVFDITNGTITAGAVTVQLIRSAGPNPPAVTYGTNLFSGNTTNLLTTDWETWSNSAPPLTLTIPINTTNHVTWITNLTSSWIGGASWVGVASITNSGVTYFVTNMDLGLSHKILPIRYP